MGGKRARSSEARGITTLVGPAGAGKSHSLRARSRRLRDAVWVDLRDVAPGAREASIVRTVARHWGLRLRSRDELLRVLASRPAHVLLDGADPVDDSLRTLVRALAQEAHVVVTARAPLGLRGEDVVLVPPLSVQAAVRHLRACSARLGAQPLSDGGLRALVASVDRLPGAIEILSCSVGLWSEGELLERACTRPGTLEGHVAAAPAVSTSIAAMSRATLAAVDAQDEPTLAAAAAMGRAFTAAELEREVGRGRVVGPLQRLVANGVVRRASVPGTFAVLATLRDALRDDARPVVRRAFELRAHALLERAEAEVQRLSTRHAKDARRELTEHAPALRALRDDPDRLGAPYATRAALCLDALGDFGPDDDARVASLRATLALAQAAQALPLRVEATLRLARVIGRRGERDEAVALTREMARASRRARDPGREIDAIVVLVPLLAQRGKLAEARTQLKRAEIQLARVPKDVARATDVLALDGWLEHVARRSAVAHAKLERAWGKARAAGDLFREALVLERLELVGDDAADGARLLALAASHYEQLGDTARAMRVAINGATRLSQAGRLEDAHRALEQVRANAGSSPYALLLAVAALALGVVVHRRALASRDERDHGRLLQEALEALLEARARLEELGVARELTLACGHLAAAYATADRVPAAEEASSASREHAAKAGAAVVTQYVDALDGLVWLARARARPQQRDVFLGQARGRLQAALDARVDGGAAVDHDRNLREIVALLRAALERDEAAGKALALERDGRALRLPDGTRLDLVAHPVLRRLVLALVGLHRTSPEATMSTSELIARVWPNERFARPASARNRLWVSIAKLRRAGLAFALQKTHDGYRLDPALVVRRA